MIKRSVLLAFILLIVTGCGQTGPLYLPGSPPPGGEAAPPVSDQNGADEEEDEDAR